MKSTERLLEQLLILRFLSGDEDAFTRLVERYQSRLRYYVRRLLGGASGEDDILQDVWLSVLKGLRNLRNSEAFRAWVYRIARNKVYQQLHKNKRHSSLSEEMDQHVESDETVSFYAEEAALIGACLEKLPERHREVLVLQFLEQMSYEEIAAVVGCSLGTVRSRIHYAKRALRRKLEGLSHDR